MVWKKGGTTGLRHTAARITQSVFHDIAGHLNSGSRTCADNRMLAYLDFSLQGLHMMSMLVLLTEKHVLRVRCQIWLARSSQDNIPPS